MFSCEIKVNGILVGHLYGYRQKESEVLNVLYPETNLTYYFRYYKVETGQVTEGEVEHNPKDSLEELQRKIFDEIRQTKKESNDGAVSS